MWGSDGVVKMLNYFCGTVECLVIFRKVLWVQPHIIIGYDLQFVRMQAFPFKYALWTTVVCGTTLQGVAMVCSTVGIVLLD